MSENRLPPKLKMDLRTALYADIYGPVINKLTKQIDQLIRENSRRISAVYPTFTYKGERFITSDVAIPNLQLMRTTYHVQEKLRPAVDAYLSERQQVISIEAHRVMGGIQNILNASNSPVDYLECLPTSIHDTIRAVCKEYLSIPQTLSAQQRAILQKHNAEAMQLLKNRLLLNLLL